MRKKKALFAIAAAAMVLAATSACSSASASTAPDANAPITVWVDGGRAPQAQAYAKAHPNPKITVNTVSSGSGDFTSKIALAKKANSNVPDVIFLTSPNEITALNANPINFPLALNGLVSQNVLDGYSDSQRCVFYGKTYCLGNDIGQTVFWYNKQLFDQWGYALPKTFDDFKALGLRMGKEHPGYSLGTVLGSYGLDSFFGSSGCPIVDATSLTTVRIDTTSPKCTRVGDVIAPLMANGTLSTLDLFDKNYTAQIADGKLAGMIGPSWIADFALKPLTKGSTTFNAAGKYAAAPMPLWSGETVNYSGLAGGGVWAVSATTRNPQAAVAMAVAMTTDPGIAKITTTYPAYKASADIWLQAKSKDPWYAENPAPVLRDAADKINTADAYVRYTTQLRVAFTATVVAHGATDMKGALAQLEKEAKQMAKVDGYTVSK